MRHRLAAVSAAGLLILTGCTASPETDPAVPSAASSETAPGPGGAVDGSGAGVASYDPADVVVSQEVTVPGSEGDTATVGVLSLTVEGSVQVLRLVVTPNFSSVSTAESVNQYAVWGTDAFRPTLVDMENLKVYSALSDTGQYWASDAVYNEAINGEPMIVWAVFAAPEDDVDAVDLRLHESWPEFTDIPVTR